MEGYEKGELCNRNGCTGIIKEHHSDGCCSCHIHPPCSYCETPREYCPECGWDAKEERDSQYVKPTQAQVDIWEAERKKWDRERDSFYEKYHTKKGIEKLEMRHESHTHFSQIIKGVFPSGSETRESILPHVKGSFGGRFNHFGECSFEYVAYTD